MQDALILIIEDDPEITAILDAYFQREGFRTVTAADPRVGLSHHQRLRPDLVVLDVKLPGMDGYEVLAAIRRAGETPVLMVTALSEDLDKLQGLRLGADDYVAKPFNPLEVIARARAILRRARGSAGAHLLRLGPLTIDPDAHEASVDGRPLPLTLTEFRLLQHMARHPGRAFSRADLIDACFRESEALDRTVDSHVSNLRRKLAQAGAEGLLTSLRGVGYRLGRAHG